MSDRALSEEAMLTSLRDIRLPADAAGGMAADLAVAIGVASLVALVLAGLFRLLSLKPARRTDSTTKARLADLAGLPEPERRVALLHLLRSLAPARYDDLKGAIYEPDGGVDLQTLEAEVRRLV